ncbi:MAG: hypothetical protein ACREYF_21155 [Gammaproteobacteria bacterium]
MRDIDRTLTELDPEMEDYYETDESEFDEYEYTDTEGIFDEATEMELASELLAVSDEAELDQFLGSLIKKVGGAVGKFVKTPYGPSVARMVKRCSQEVLADRRWRSWHGYRRTAGGASAVKWFPKQAGPLAWSWKD